MYIVEPEIWIAFGSIILGVLDWKYRQFEWWQILAVLIFGVFASGFFIQTKTDMLITVMWLTITVVNGVMGKAGLADLMLLPLVIIAPFTSAIVLLVNAIVLPIGKLILKMNEFPFITTFVVVWLMVIVWQGGQIYHACDYIGQENCNMLIEYRTEYDTHLSNDLYTNIEGGQNG
jgi:hypothetical protein